MATIVQPYNPWREQMAAGILGPLIGGMIQRGQEAERNRKLNALRGALNERMTATPESMIADISTDPAAVMPEMPKLGGELSPWQGSFEGIARPNVAQVGDAAGSAWLSPRRAATPHEALAELLATPRFGMLDPKAAYEALNPYLQDYQAREDRQRRLDYLSNFKPTDPSDALQYVTQGMALGYLPKEALVSWEKWGEHQTPHHTLNTVDTGTGVLGMDYDPATGGVRNVFSASKGVTPDTTARVGLGYAELGEKGREFDQGHNLEERKFAETVTDNEFKRRIKLWEMENPECQIVRNDLGDHVEVYAVNPRTGETKELFNGKVGMSPKDAAAVEVAKAKSGNTVTAKDQWEKQITAYDKQIAAVQRQMKDRDIRIEAASIDAKGRRHEPPGELVYEREQLRAKEKELVEAQRKLLQSGQPYGYQPAQPTTPEKLIADMAVASGDVSPESYAAVMPETARTVNPTVSATPQIISREDWQALVSYYGPNRAAEILRQNNGRVEQ
ncbi:MAG: hypothetical protein IJU98_03420 [Synergistaceae bacterium]|nr:hypothetical protein [Synergistaceae bacterium]